MSSLSSDVPPGLKPLGGTPPLRDYVRQVWARREFAWTSAVGELRAQHMDTALGNLWHLLNPALLIGVYYVVFGLVLDTSRGLEGDNFIGFLAIGVIAYRWSQSSITSGARTIVRSQGLIRSLQFPRALLPLSVIIKETLAFFPGVLMMVVVVLATGEGLTPSWLSVVPIFLLQVTFNLGGALLISRVADKFHDTVNLLPFVFRLVFYGSGVLYPVNQRFDFFETRPWLVDAFSVNPFYSQVGLWRDALMTSEEIPSVHLMWISAAVWAVVLLVVGLLVFRAGEKEYGRG